MLRVVIKPSPAAEEAVLIVEFRDNHTTTMAVVQWQGRCRATAAQTVVIAICDA
jgi:hypothetical protein